MKPSQADFNPGKVSKAGAPRGAGDATSCRILVSSDTHVVDGHHQWMDLLQNAPDEPMPALRINAPAKEILSQVQEVPSAGLENSPDIPGQAAVPHQQGDTAKRTAAHAWLASERTAGRDPASADLTRKFLGSPQGSRQIITDQHAAETAPIGAKTPARIVLPAQPGDTPAIHSARNWPAGKQSACWPSRPRPWRSPARLSFHPRTFPSAHSPKPSGGG